MASLLEYKLRDLDAKEDIVPCMLSPDVITVSIPTDVNINEVVVDPTEFYAVYR